MIETGAQPYCPRPPPDRPRWVEDRNAAVDNRQHQADITVVRPSEHAEAIYAAWSELQEQLPSRTQRRHAEHALAEYIEHAICPHTDDAKIHKLPDSLRICRTCGNWGMRPDGSLVTAWDHKCGQVKLCPDEARQETRRLAERYIPVLVDHARAGKRLYFAVFTMPNFAPGKLAHGKKKIFERLKGLLRKRHNKRLVFPTLQRRGDRDTPPERNGGGALVVQEDPLSAHGDWNVHLNVILVSDGYLDYRVLQHAWYWNVEIRRLEGSVDELVSTFNELIKYVSLTVPEKSAKHAVDGRAAAPAMVEWTAALWLEWYRAQKAVRRRTRSYGCLHHVGKPERIERLEDVRWFGTVSYSGATATYNSTGPRLVDLIPEDNSTTGDYGKRGHPATGPPAPDVAKWLSDYERAAAREASGRRRVC